jgi:hypothetical protein
VVILLHSDSNENRHDSFESEENSKGYIHAISTTQVIEFTTNVIIPPYKKTVMTLNKIETRYSFLSYHSWV